MEGLKLRAARSERWRTSPAPGPRAGSTRALSQSPGTTRAAAPEISTLTRAAARSFGSPDEIRQERRERRRIDDHQRRQVQKGRSHQQSHRQHPEMFCHWSTPVRFPTLVGGFPPLDPRIRRVSRRDDRPDARLRLAAQSGIRCLSHTIPPRKGPWKTGAPRQPSPTRIGVIGVSLSPVLKPADSSAAL